MGATINSNHKEPATAFRLVNTTGANLVANEFTVMRGRALRALEAIVSTADGAFQDLAGCEFEVNEFDTNEGTFAAADLAVYFDPTAKKFSHVASVGHFKVGYSKAAKDAGGVLDVIGCAPVEVVDGVAELASALETAEGDIDDLEAVNTLAGGTPFIRTATLTALAGGTAVHVLAAADVGAGFKAFVTGFKATVSGGTAWSGGTGTKVALQDTNGTPVVGAEIAVAGLAGNAVIAEGHANVTLKAAMASGFTAAKGIDIKGDNNFGAGSDLVVTITGFIVAAA